MRGRTSSARVATTAAVALLAVCVGAPAAIAGVGRVHVSEVQQGLNFYRGKTISFISPGPPAAAFDLLARDLAPYFAAYLHASVEVTDVSTGATIPGQDLTEAAKPDGLTIGELNSVGDAANALTHTPGINFSPARVAYISSTGPSPLVLLATPSSGITSFAQLFNESPAARALTQPTGTGPTITRSLMGVLHVPVNWLTGYANSSQQVTGFLRGDGQLAWVTLSIGGPLIQNGVARVLAATAQAPKGTAYGNLITGVPTTAQLLARYPAKNKSERTAYAAVTTINSMAAVLPIFTQTGVAADKVAALRAAAKWAFSRSSLRVEMLNQGQSDVYADPVQAKQLYIDALKYGSVLVPYIEG